MSWTNLLQSISDKKRYKMSIEDKAKEKARLIEKWKKKFAEQKN